MCFVYSPLVVPFVSWKSILVLALDACFKLKLKDRSFFDPDLGTRLAYMVDDDKYRLHLSQSSKDPPPHEVRRLVPVAAQQSLTLFFQVMACGSKLHAVNDAHTKSSRGYLATGVVISSCRHALVRSNGAADLQRGERYGRLISYTRVTHLSLQIH